MLKRLFLTWLMLMWPLFQFLPAEPLAARPQYMLLGQNYTPVIPVTFEAAATGINWTTATTSVSFSITLGGTSSTRAVLVGIAHHSTGATGITVTVGGQSASLISGTDTGSTYTRRTMLYGIATTLTGAQTVAISWTSAQDGCASAISAVNVNQTTPFDSGTMYGYTGSASSISRTVTSVYGDLTSTMVLMLPYTLTPTTNQNQKWTQTASGQQIALGDIGGGLGTTTHTWTASSTASAMSGTNFVSVSNGN